MAFLRNLIKRCKITKKADDVNDVRLQQITDNGRVDDAEVYMPYGTSANIPVGSFCIKIQVGNDSGYSVVLPDRSQDRVKDLKEGEVAFFHPLTKSRTIYRENGDIEQVVAGDNGDKLITIKKDMKITIGGDADINITGDADVIAGGDVVIDAGGKIDIISGTNVKIDAVANVDVLSGGNTSVIATGSASIMATGAATLQGATAVVSSPTSVSLVAPAISLGTGGSAIARVGDTVQVTVTGGSSAGTYNGTITSGGTSTAV